MEQKVVMTDIRKKDYFYEEAIKTLRTNIQFTGKNVKTIMFTSCFPNEGKSDVTFQLCQEIGNMGKRVLLIDADIRRSAYVSRYRIKQKVNGLSQYLSGQLAKEFLIYQTNFLNVDIIFAGPMAPNPSELLEESAFHELLTEIREYYDYIIIDTPPVGSVIDAAIIAKESDGAVLVIESERVSYKVAQKVKEQMEKTGCKLLGVVLNKVNIEKNKYYGKYDYYYSSDSKKR
ncbi:CpsD/CapB family tyrosine-protein kinase [Blautia sp. Marseille-P3201T]|uniref:CpsD/CapB family tyrosine-protein kinase n=1 Tax=Blautia sp. Marseille-P3201T TaxID=1907659 RepID=UPI000AC0CF82|nr:CpsD/CapB family tyrosine-protein kinase [Blautia sp. Marseille-P3201T]